MPHIQFDKTIVTFDFPHCLQYYSSSHQAVIISGIYTLFDHHPCLPTLSNQVVNVSSADYFAPNSRSRLLSYHRYCPCPSPHQAVNISSIDKPTNRRSRSTSSSISSQTSVGADTPWSYNPCSQYFYNFCHRFDIADSLKTMNQELLRPKDWVSPIVPDSQEKFAELTTIDILMIEAALFNTLVQQATHAKNMEIFNISICNIEKALTLKSITNSAKKLPTKYHDFLNIFSQADSDILPLYPPYDHKILLMEEKTLPWGLLNSISQDELKVLKKYLK